MMTLRPANQPGLYQNLLSQSLFLGAVAGCLDTFLVFNTGAMSLRDVGLNSALLMAVLVLTGGVAGRVSMSWPVLGEAALLSVSMLVFSARSCSIDCGPSSGRRSLIPVAFVVISVLALARLRTTSPKRVAPVFLVITVTAMVMEALRFAHRDGIPMSPPLLADFAVPAALLAGIGAVVASRGWVLHGLCALLLVGSTLAWAGVRARPIRIEPVVIERKSVSQEKSTAPNVVLIVMDTVRADHLSFLGYRRKTSPNLELLASESLAFDRAIASGNYSLPSHASLFTGVLPSQHGAHQRAAPDTGRSGSHGLRPSTPPGLEATFDPIERWADAINDLPDFAMAPGVESIAEKLLASGYSTGGLSANFIYLRPWTGLQRGFLEFDDRAQRKLGYHPALRLLEKRPLERASDFSEWDGPSVTQAGLSFARGSSPPFFLFLNYFDAHHPFVERAGFRFRGDGLGKDTQSVPNYDSEIAFVDAAIGTLVDGLRQSGLIDNTILIITADHGEFFKEHGLWGHRKAGAYEPVLHVPLLIRYPQRLRPGRISAPFGLIEVRRLLFDLLGGLPVEWAYDELPRPKVLAQIWGRVTSTDRPATPGVEPDANMVYDGAYKLIDRSRGDDELYDLAADPQEEHNLLKQPGPEIRGQKERMETAVRNLPPAKWGAVRSLTDSDLAALQGIGYITAGRPNPKKD